jgi:hypothetical protein
MRSDSKVLRALPLGLSICTALTAGAIPASCLAATVQNCGDGGPGSGSLRDVIAGAAPGETIDMTQLPAKCGMANSVITLLGGEIAIAQDDLRLQGPSEGSVTIQVAAGTNARIFEHTGIGVLAINDLTLTNGNVHAGPAPAFGGCVLSNGTVFMTRGVAAHCSASGSDARGGALYAQNIVLSKSTISDSHAIGTQFGAGGGIYSSGLSVFYSTVRGNSASDSGGGIMSNSATPGVYSYINNSTIEGNSSKFCAGAYLATTHGSHIANTTVSRNFATEHDGGVCTAGSASIRSSTIAYNSSTLWSGGLKQFEGNIELQSTILAMNAGPSTTDLYLLNSTASGADNLILTVTGNVPAGLIKVSLDPKLGPLAYNGGFTKTHMLMPDSPAIGSGNNAEAASSDQRGKGYPRSTGPSYLTDIGAIQAETILVSDFERW